MVTYTTSYEGRKIVFKPQHVYEYTDHAGRTGVLTEYGFALRRTMLDFEVKNGVDLALWFKRNVGVLSSSRIPQEVREALTVQCDVTTDYVDHSSLESMTDRDIEDRVRYYGRPYELREWLWIFESTPPNSFELLSEGGEDPEVHYESVYPAADPCLYLRPVSPATTTYTRVPDMWSNKHNYSFKMDPTEYNFYRGTPKYVAGVTYLGVELEVCTKLSYMEIQTIVTQVEPKQEPFFIFKDDSSISGKYRNRVEIVTVPCTPKYLKREFSLFFNKIEKLAAAKGKTLGDYFDVSPELTNGLHIHIDRKAFGESRAPLALKKFLLAMNCGDKLLDKIAQRPQGVENNHYCQRDRRVKKYRKAVYLKEAADGSTPRTSIVNTTNRTTVEVRAFQGIFNLDHVLTAIRFVDAMIAFSHEVSIGSLSLFGFKESFLPFINKDRTHSALAKELA